jgi:cyclophilin family peptidyl-prolyl cis-trans isomerase
MATQKRQRKKTGRQARQQAIAAERRRQSRRRTLIVTVVVVAIVALIAGVTGAFSSGSSSKKSATESTTPVSLKPVAKGASITGPTPCPKADGSSPRTTSFAQPPPMCIDPAKTYTAAMKTTKGTMTITLDPKKAPNTVNNFVVLSRYHFYDGIAFHRIIPGFVDQVGDPDETGSGGPGYQFADELPGPGGYAPGSVAMANSGPNTNGSQIFIIVGRGDTLPVNYSLFGQVTAGLDVAQAINKFGTNDEQGKPTQVIKIDSVSVQES